MHLLFYWQNLCSGRMTGKPEVTTRSCWWLRTVAELVANAVLDGHVFESQNAV